MLSQTVEYALRAVVFLAAGPPELRTNQEIAEGTHVPASYLTKVLQGLRRVGIVETQRGIGGGSRLARDAGRITVLDVVNAVDPIRRIEACPLGRAGHDRQLCPLHSKLDRATAMVEESFASTSIREMLDPCNPAQPLCQIAAADPA